MARERRNLSLTIDAVGTEKSKEPRMAARGREAIGPNKPLSPLLSKAGGDLALVFCFSLLFSIFFSTFRIHMWTDFNTVFLSCTFSRLPTTTVFAP